MRHGGETVLLLDAIDDHQGLIARAAAGAVGHGAKIRLGLHQGRDGFLEQVLIALGSFGRKKFKGNHRLAGGDFGGVNLPNQFGAVIRLCCSSVQIVGPKIAEAAEMVASIKSTHPDMMMCVNAERGTRNAV